MRANAYKVVRGPAIVALHVPDEDVIGPDSHRKGAFMARRAFVVSGGGCSVGDSRIRYVRGKWVYPDANDLQRFDDGRKAIYAFRDRQKAELLCMEWFGRMPGENRRAALRWRAQG